jgi:hypothetical protein
MHRLEGRSKELFQYNPEENLTEAQSPSSRTFQLREEKLNAELLRIKSQHMQKYVEQTWNMNEEELIEFFSNYQSLCQVIDMGELMNSESKLVRT